MNYAIDNDSLRVISKSENKEVLDTFVEDNSLELAISIVSSPDNLELNFTVKELKVIAEEVVGKSNFEDEELPIRILQALELEDIPEFSIKKAKKQFRISEERSSDKLEEIHEKAPKKEPKKEPKSSKKTYNDDQPISVVDTKCKSGSILATIVTAIEDELCSTIGEVKNYIMMNHVIAKTGDLADEKFANHNIRYFISQGKLKLEEDL